MDVGHEQARKVERTERYKTVLSIWDFSRGMFNVR